jgi:hypothetical protein
MVVLIDDAKRKSRSFTPLKSASFRMTIKKSKYGSPVRLRSGQAFDFAQNNRRSFDSLRSGWQL